jgi:hypothetical protein
LSKVIALIDLDTPVYKAAAAVEERGIIVTHSPTGIQKSFSTRTEFKDLLKSKDRIDKLSEYEIEDTQEAEPAEHAFHFAFYEGQFGHFQGFCFFSQGLQEQGFKGIGFGMVGVNFKKFFCVLETFFIVLGVVEFLGGEGGTASCL